MSGYARSATCSFTGVHQVDRITGKCLFCELQVEKTAAALETAGAKKKGMPDLAHPLRRLLPPR